MNWVLMVMAGAVSAAYFTIAAVIVPRITLVDASRRFTLLFRGGAIAFFVGCGLSHLHIAVDAVTTPSSVHIHELLFHTLQVAGGWLFIFAAVKFLDIRVERRRSPDADRMAELQDLALRDQLTGAFNRRHFEEVVAQELNRHDRYGGEAAVLLLDLDNFKSVNDSRGHDAGDAVLRGTVNILAGTLRPSDTVARLGGDEFAVLLPSTGRMHAVAAAERIRAAVLADDFGIGHTASVCIGVAGAPDGAQSPLDLITAADRAMYWAKRNGKNRTALADARREDAAGAVPEESSSHPGGE
jgi:diguanylate cyclase (GGDEF)-like protein